MTDRRLQHMSILDTPGLRAAVRTAASQVPTESTVVGVLRAVESSPSWRVQVDVLGGQVWLGANPGAYVVGGGVHVLVEGGRPTWVTGPTDQEVPYSEGPSTVREGAKPFVLKPAAVLDQGARDEANDVITKIGRAFVTSLDAPMPEDGEDRPNGAIWTRTDPDGSPAARWRWDATEGAWVSVPVDGVEIFSEAFIDTLATNSVLAQRLTLASEVDGWITQVSGRGLETFRPDGVAAIQLGNFGENYLQLSTPENVVGVALDQSGGVNAINGSFNDSLRYKGIELDDRLSETGGRVIAWGGDVPTAFSILDPPSGSGERALFELAAEATEPNRYWEMGVGSFLVDTAGTGWVGLRIRYTADGTTPSLTSPVLGYHYLTVSGTSQVAFNFPIRPVTPLQGQVYRFLVTMFSTGPSVQVNTSPQNTVWGRVLDLGPVPERSFVVRHDRHYSSDPAPVPDPPAPVKRRYVNDTLGRAWHKVWEQGGGSPAAIQGSVIQGRTPYYPAAGIYRSMVGFPSLTGMLAGAAIESIQVMVRAEHWYSHAGGRIDIGLHGAGSAPGSFSEMHHGVASARLGVGGSTWITIPSAYYAGFRDGTYRGITVFRNSDDPVDYGKFTPSEFRIRATYVK